MTSSCHIDFTQPLSAGAARLRHRFEAPREVLVAQALHEVRGVLDAVFAAAQQGRWCVGHVRYEAAPAFDAALQTHATDGPLAWFAVYDAPQPGTDDAADAAAAATPAQVVWDDSPEREEFDAALAQIQQAIAAGELYQVNYTAPFRGTLQGSPQALFAAPVSYTHLRAHET